MTLPDSQRERAAAFTAAVLAGQADIARALASAPPPRDATAAERARWTLRRRLYQRR